MFFQCYNEQSHILTQNTSDYMTYEDFKNICSIYNLKTTGFYMVDGYT